MVPVCLGISGTNAGLNAVPLESAVLCAECDVVSDSPHDVCMVCGSHSLFNISRVFGGKLPQQRASLVAQTPVETSSLELVLPCPKPHRVRRREQRDRDNLQLSSSTKVRPMKSRATRAKGPINSSSYLQESFSETRQSSMR